MDAAYYQAHKDDLDLWGEPDHVATRQAQGLGATITVRFSPEDAANIRRVAKELGLSYSQVVRQAVRYFTQAESAIAAKEGSALLDPNSAPTDQAGSKSIAKR